MSELDEILRRGAIYSKTLPREAYGSTNSRTAEPCTHEWETKIES